jgi:hypothetical protein
MPSFSCAEGATEISPGLERSDYPGKSSHKINLPLRLDRGEGWGEVSNSTQSTKLNHEPRELHEIFRHDLSRLGNGEWNLAKPKARASESISRINPNQRTESPKENSPGQAKRNKRSPGLIIKTFCKPCKGDRNPIALNCRIDDGKFRTQTRQQTYGLERHTSSN